jgi:hypothetical protein
MLLIDDKLVSRRELADKFGIDLVKLEKQPSFEIDKSKISNDRANGNVAKVNAGTSIRSHFYAVDAKTGLTIEIKYAKGKSERTVGDKRYTEYSPRYVRFFKELQDGGQHSGTKFSFQDDLDLAMYFCLHPQNKFSPLRSKSKKTTVGYEFIDSKARAIDKMSNLNKTAESMAHAKDIDDFKLVIMCKGLGFQKVDSKELDTLRADLLEFALNKPEAYMTAIETGIVHSEGLIINLIDRGVLSLTKTHGVRQWEWTSGEREGEPIGSPITNPTQDAKSSIKTFILNNIHTYNSVLNSTTDAINAKEKAKAFFKTDVEEKKIVGDALPEHLKSVNQELYESTPLPVDFQSAKEYVGAKGYAKIPTNVKTFLEAIKAGDVTEDNASAFLRQLYEK